MSVQDMIDLLMDLPDKQIEFVIPIETGYASACPANSEIAYASTGEAIFVAMPCVCHQDDDTEIITDLQADDFDMNLN